MSAPPLRVVINENHVRGQNIVRTPARIAPPAPRVKLEPGLTPPPPSSPPPLPSSPRLINLDTPAKPNQPMNESFSTFAAHRLETGGDPIASASGMTFI